SPAETLPSMTGGFSKRVAVNSPTFNRPISAPWTAIAQSAAEAATKRIILFCMIVVGPLKEHYICKPAPGRERIRKRNLSQCHDAQPGPLPNLRICRMDFVVAAETLLLVCIRVLCRESGQPHLAARSTCPGSDWRARNRLPVFETRFP